MSLTLFIIRHGERMDHVEYGFGYTSPTPYDPPITPKGKIQAKKTGAYIRDVQLETAVKDDDQRNVEYVIHTSPFLRTAETAIGIAEGIATSQPNLPASAIKFRIDSALSEWHTSAYYANAVPNNIITSRVEELHRLTRHDQETAQQQEDQPQPPFFEVDWSYKPILNELPVYPEGIHDVLKRCLKVLEGITEPYIENLQQGSSKNIVLLIVTHGWCFNVIQEACSSNAPRKEPEFCAVSRARWVPKGEDEKIPEINIIAADDNVNYRQSIFPKANNPFGKWIVDIIANTEHLKGVL